LVFFTRGVELNRKTDFGGFVNDLGPEVKQLATWELNLEPNKLTNFNLAARKHETAVAADISYRSFIVRSDTFPASWKVNSNPWSRSPLYPHGKRS
jgi:hypothetical protein